MGFDILETEVETEPDMPETAEEAYASLVNGVMNHGAKTVTALALDEEPKGKTGIYEAAVREAGHKPDASHRFIPSRSTIQDYLSESLVDIGFVGKETITEAQHPTMEGGTAYRISEFGKHMQPVLAYGIKATSEADHLEELEEALGPTYSSGDGRSPLRRSKILHSLREDAHTNIEIAEEHGMDRSQVTNLTSRLDEEGVIDRTKFYTEGGNYFKRNPDIPADEAETVEQYGELTEEIVEVLERDQVTNSEQLREELNATSSIRSVLRGLEEQGVVEELPNLQLTEKGEEALSILDDTAYAVNQYMQSDAETLTEALDAMPDYISDTWEEYQEDTEQFREEYNMDIWNTSRLNSSKVDALDPEEAHRRVEQIVRQYDEPISSEQVAEEWEKQYDEKRTKKTIDSYLRKNDNLNNQEQEGYHKLWDLEE